MRRASYYIVFSTIAIAALVLSACGKKKAADGRTDTPISGTIKFAADESFAPIIEEELQTYQYRFPQTIISAAASCNTSSGKTAGPAEKL